MTEHDLSAADHERLLKAFERALNWASIDARANEPDYALASLLDGEPYVSGLIADMLAAARQEARDEAVAAVEALAENVERVGEYEAANAIRAALGDSGALARIRAEALEDSRAVRRLREAAERRGAERERERIAQAIEADDPAGYFADDVAEGYRIGQEFAARIARGADGPAEAEPPDDRPCYRCGRNPAEGFASVWTAKDGERWYCHGDDDESPTCYEGANVADDPAEAARGGE